MLPGCAVLEGLTTLWSVPQLSVADRGLREGMLLRMMQGNYPLPPPTTGPQLQIHRREGNRLMAPSTAQAHRQFRAQRWASGPEP